jgi:WD40 repeat protein
MVSIRIWDLKEGTSISLKGHGESDWWGGVNSVAFHPTGKLLASGSNDKPIKLWSVKKGEHLYSLNGHSDGVLCVAFSPDGKLIATGCGDKIIRLIPLEQNQFRLLENLLDESV